MEGKGRMSSMAEETEMEEVRMHVQRRPAPKPLFSISMDDCLRLFHMQTNYSKRKNERLEVSLVESSKD
ncbi:MAG: hypothetical protein DRN03_01340 [Thermoplasmata archaeon]|nr:MAG: hypothetical protein DRN03_01340 [Thermoplasmata archaeon]RLF93290.1 MAG: hypothetical protein DRN52_06685 [Thermococci archaeon]